MVTVDFVKGHMGGDEVILLDGTQIPERYRAGLIRSVLMTPSIRGREVGLLHPPRKKGDIRVKIHELSSKGAIPMCGGLTQVLGKALVETNLAKRFAIRLRRRQALVKLETDSGLIPIHISIRGRRAVSVSTEMDSYVEQCYRWGTEDSNIGGVPVERVGQFYFMDLSDLEKKYPGVDFTQNNRECLKVIDEMRRVSDLEKMYGVVKRAGKPGHLDAAFRFVPPDPLALEGEEFACGTGSTTAAIYEQLHNRLPVDARGHGHLSLKLFSTGMLPVDQRTEVDLEVRNGRVAKASFSHNYVRLIAQGKLHI